MTKDEEIEFEALVERLRLPAETAQALRDFIDKVGDGAYERGQANMQEAAGSQF